MRNLRRLRRHRISESVFADMQISVEDMKRNLTPFNIEVAYYNNMVETLKKYMNAIEKGRELRPHELRSLKDTLVNMQRTIRNIVKNQRNATSAIMALISDID